MDRIELARLVDDAPFALDADGLRQAELSYRPMVFRGAVGDWPAVAAGRASDEQLAGYLKRFDTGRPTEVMVGPPEIAGRFFYNDALTGCNFQKRLGSLSALIDRMLAVRSDPYPDAIYAGAATADDHLPGWQADNALPVSPPGAVARLWVGNATHVTTHFDEASNIAAVIAGRRRFTLFPPEQAENLYVGPLHFTIAGPPVSMVDIDQPDLDRYPNYAEAARHRLVADLEPGDAIYIPPIWWHNVKALAPVNVMVNYWWEPEGAVSPLDTLHRAILAMRDLPAPYRAAWRSWFDRYVFDDDASDRVQHLPPHLRTLPPPR